MPPLSAADPNDVGLLVYTAAAQSFNSEQQRKLEQYESALASVSTAIDYCKRAEKLDPNSSKAKHILASATVARGRIHQATDNLEAAITDVSDALTLLRGLTNRQPSNKGYAFQVVTTANQLADLKQATQDYDEACSVYREAIREVKRMQSNGMDPQRTPQYLKLLESKIANCQLLAEAMGDITDLSAIPSTKKRELLRLRGIEMIRLKRVDASLEALDLLGSYR